MKNDLIERYIYAVTKRLPKKMQDDVSQELKTLIDDMLMERCGDATPNEYDIKSVLTELGTPNELYEKYNPQTDKCLIGSPYYSTYKYVLKIVMLCAGLGLLLATLLSTVIDFFETGASNVADFFVSFFTELFITVPSGLIWGFAFVTILFAIFYRKGVNIETKLDDLPPVPKKKQSISKAECIVGIVFTTIFLCVFLFAPQVFCAITTNDAGVTIITEIFNNDVIKASWLFIIIFSLAGIVREIVKLIEGRHNKKVMATTIVTNIISAVVTVLFLTRDNIINPEFTANISVIFDSTDKWITQLFANFNVFLLVVILLALTADIAETIYKTFKK